MVSAIFSGTILFSASGIIFSLLSSSSVIAEAIINALSNFISFVTFGICPSISPLNNPGKAKELFI